MGPEPAAAQHGDALDMVRAPGKVFLTGEYAVLWGAPACIAAVEPPVSATRWLLPSGRFELEVPGGLARGERRGDRVIWDRESPALQFASRALGLALERRPPDAPGLRVAFASNPKAPGRRKLGLGTSAAACTAAALSGLALDHRVPPPTPEDVFRVAAQAHWEVQGRRGSNGDVAASAFGGVVRYERYPLEAEAPLPPVRVARVSPADLRLGMVYSGHPARTPSMVTRVEAALSAADRQTYARESAAITDALVAALDAPAPQLALEALNAAGTLLADLGQRTGVGVVTAELAAILTLGRSVGVAAKVTGAGGGDGAIFAAFDAALLRHALQEAERQGYVTLELPIAPGALLASVGPPNRR